LGVAELDNGDSVSIEEVEMNFPHGLSGKALYERGKLHRLMANFDFLSFSA
jgi:hypothetical protein